MIIEYFNIVKIEKEQKFVQDKTHKKHEKRYLTKSI